VYFVIEIVVVFVLYIPVFWVHGTLAEMLFIVSMHSYMQNYYKQKKKRKKKLGVSNDNMCG